jgi:hypothetical protein
MGDVGKSLISVIAGVTGLAIIAVLVSRQAQTTQILNATFGGYTSALRAAVSPVRAG